MSAKEPQNPSSINRQMKDFKETNKAEHKNLNVSIKPSISKRSNPMSAQMSAKEPQNPSSMNRQMKETNKAEFKSLPASIKPNLPKRSNPIPATSSLPTRNFKPKRIVKPTPAPLPSMELKPKSTIKTPALKLSGVSTPMTTEMTSAKLPEMISNITLEKPISKKEPTKVATPTIPKPKPATSLTLPSNIAKTETNQSRMKPRCRSPGTEKISLNETKKIHRSNYSHKYMRFRRDDIKNKEVFLKFINKSFMVLEGKIKYLHISDSEDTVFLCGGVTDRVLVENCKNCSVVAVTAQLNIRASMCCAMYLHVTKTSVMENCQHISFGEYDHYYHNCEDDFHAMLSYSSNKYSDVVDYSQMKPKRSDAGNECTKNWSLISCDSLPDWTLQKGKFKEKFMDNLK